MKITKFGHACLLVEQDGQSLILDPGGWSDSLVIPDNVIAIVVTHVHQDHLDKDRVKAIVDKNADAVVIGHEAVTAELEEFNTQSAVPNEGIKIGNFELEFFGGEHAVIVEDWPIDANLGVLVNGRLYHPGDSFTVPDDREIELLALPVSAPWLKFNETAKFLLAVAPKLAFPIHDAILSDAGKQLADRMVPRVTQNVGTKYRRIDDSPLDV